MDPSGAVCMVVKMPNKDFTGGTQGKGDNNNMNNNKKAEP